MSMPAFIWDLDGTLFDSYGVMVSSIVDTMNGFGVQLDYNKVHEFVIRYSVNKFFVEISKNTGINIDSIRASYNLISSNRVFDITLMNNARDALYALTLKRYRHFVYTHRGLSSNVLIDHFNMRHVFEEVVTSQNEFPRKPAPDALNYLISKYYLDRENTYYVGDRILDMESANNAGIKGILYLKPNGVGETTNLATYVVSDLMEIPNLSVFK
ncbi:MAG: HAD-IA family hydrolase [Clostridia bacterium]|nr:HAD-IA family hydrolase [Clostridia bacterium]